MTRPRLYALGLALALASLAPAGPAQAAGVDQHQQPVVGAPLRGASLPGAALPGVTAADTSQAGDAPPVASLPAVDIRPVPKAGQKSARAAVPQSQTLALTPGVNQVIPISRGHLNRIITPFPHPAVRTVSSAKIDTEGAVIYVAVSGSAPVTMYVSPKGQQGLALSLTLAPQAIAPRQIRLKIAGQGGGRYHSAPQARHWERARPFVDTIKAAMRALALGKVPDGYGLHPWHAGDPAVGCTQPGLKVQPGQTLPGANLILVVSRLTNISAQRLSVQEASCRRRGVLAVAAWPHASLAPGEHVELYTVMARPHQAEDQARARPSLLGDGEGQ